MSECKVCGYTDKEVTIVNELCSVHTCEVCKGEGYATELGDGDILCDSCYDSKKGLPQRINAMKVVSYDVQQIVEALMAENEIEADKVTLEMVMDRVETWASEDINDSRDDMIIYQDENGEEL